jgi:AcrR family transcriptional regulator
MGISERREREKNERRKTILDCARELILTQGVQRVSMEEIAHKAELSKATVYLYFSSKDILFNEICEDAARFFLDHLKPFLESGVTGMDALKYFWRGYDELFGNTDEMVIIFQVRNFLYPGLPIVPLEDQIRSPNVDAILGALLNMIEQCKAEGVFDSSLDSAMAARLLLSTFSSTIENASHLPPELRKSRLKEDMKNAFQIMIRGFASEGMKRSMLSML